MTQIALRVVSRVKGKLTSDHNLINAFMMRHPKGTSIAFTTIKTIVADLVTQTLIERTSIGDINWSRNAVFATFGFLYMGCFQYWLFNTIFFKFFPGTSFTQTLKKVCCDSFIKAPFFYFPFFYLIRTFVHEREKFFQRETVLSLKTTYKKNISGDLKRFWSLWFPVNMITFGVMPIHLRLPFIASISFFWCICLSIIHGHYDHTEEVEIAVAKEYELQ